MSCLFVKRPFGSTVCPCICECERGLSRHHCLPQGVGLADLLSNGQVSLTQLVPR